MSMSFTNFLSFVTSRVKSVDLEVLVISVALFIFVFK